MLRPYMSTKYAKLNRFPTYPMARQRDWRRRVHPPYGGLRPYNKTTRFARLSKSSAKRLREHLWFRVMVYIVLAYIAWLAALYFFWQDRIIFPRHIAPAPLLSLDRGGTEVITLDIEGGGTVETWFLPAPGVGEHNPGAAVVFFHGNGEIIDYLDEIVLAYHRLGCSVLLPEYRGYGRSAGRQESKKMLRCQFCSQNRWSCE